MQKKLLTDINLLIAAKYLFKVGKYIHVPGVTRFGLWMEHQLNIVYYFLSLRIRVTYLSFYCPFFNPTEIVFGVIKSHLQKDYIENSSLGKMIIFPLKLFNRFEFKNMYKIFKKCGCLGEGSFDPRHAFCQDILRFGY